MSHILHNITDGATPPKRRIPPTADMARALALAAIVLLSMISAMAGTAPKPAAAETAADTTADRHLLIINSYSNDEALSNYIATHLGLLMENTAGISSDIAHLNQTSVTDSTIYAAISDNLFREYSSTDHPDYLVMIGNFAFSFRERIRAEWGEIPMLLVSHLREYGSQQDYIISSDLDRPISQFPLSSLRDEYNFTCIFLRDYTCRNMDLMLSLIPDMDKLVYLSDGTYVNRVIARKMDIYLQEISPQAEFEWLCASPEASEVFAYHMTHKQPQTGLLLSSWAYPTFSAWDTYKSSRQDLQLVSNAANPVFTNWTTHRDLGTIGGVYDDIDDITAHAHEVVNAMLHGESMRDIPFYDPDMATPRINYPLLLRHGLKESNCPSDTAFDLKPTPWWESHLLIIALAIVLLLCIATLLWRLFARQKRTIEDLRGRSDLVSKMPIPYSRVKVRLTPDGHMLNVKYDIHNNAFDDIFEKNVVQNGELHFHTDKEISRIAQHIMKTRQPKFFSQYFEQTDSHFDFMIFPVAQKTNKDTTKACVLDIFIIDNTQRHKMEQKEREYLVSMDLTLQIAKLIPWQWDYKKQRLTMSARFFDETADPSQEREMAWDEFSRIVHDEDLPLLNDQFRLIQERKTTQIHVKYRIKSDKHPQGYEWLETYAKVTEMDKDGNYVKMLGTIQNITERKTQLQQLRDAVAKANESDRLKSAFLANMSHEIRTPLNAIVGFSHMLAHSPDSQNAEKFIQIIDRNNDMLLTMINDVLDLAKIESNTIDLHYTVCDINDLLDSITKTIAPRVPAGVRLNLALYADTCVVEADANRVSQIVINLLTNACKFTSKGSITLGYEIHDDKDLYIYVRDTGVGINKEEQEKVFDQFVKLDNFTQGTGLGLSICRTLTHRMDGRIGCESPGKGRGSTFWFTIPYAPVHIDQRHDEVTEDKPTAAPQQLEVYEIDDSAIPLRISGRPTILVAEDNTSNSWLIQHMLQKEFDLIITSNGREAYETYKQRRAEIDIILMDINMPVMDGYEAVAKIREVSQNVPIIAVTAYAFDTDRERILDSGFNGFVPKPITPSQLAEALNTHLAVEPAP